MNRISSFVESSTAVVASLLTPSAYDKVAVVYDNLGNVGIVVANVSDISTVATNIVDVNNAEENANTAITKAQEASDSAAAALLSENNAKTAESSIAASSAQIQTNLDSITAILLGSDTLLDTFVEVEAELELKAVATDVYTKAEADLLYEPVDGTIVKDVDIGVNVAAYDPTLEIGATADQTDAEIKTAYENNADTNALTDARATIVDNVTTNLAGKLDSSAFTSDAIITLLENDTDFTIDLGGL